MAKLTRFQRDVIAELDAMHEVGEIGKRARDKAVADVSKSSDDYNDDTGMSVSEAASLAVGVTS